jgi:hypothetical protein
MAFITVNAPLARTCVPGIAGVSSATRALATKRRSAKCGRLLPANPVNLRLISSQCGDR